MVKTNNTSDRRYYIDINTMKDDIYGMREYTTMSTMRKNNTQYLHFHELHIRHNTQNPHAHIGIHSLAKILKLAKTSLFLNSFEFVFQ